jgi:c-di-GMP-binding flagellar brake protein YcgR
MPHERLAMSNVGVDLLSLNALVILRIAQSDAEFASRIEDVDQETVIVAAPAGGSAMLFATASREIQLSWVSARGRYEQSCDLVEVIGGVLKRWRLRPVGRAVLIQRRRYIRVRAAIAVLVFLPSEVLPATTIDISEGGLRLRMAQREIEDHTPTAVHMAMGGTAIDVTGFVLRSTKIEGRQTEAVVAFETEGPGTDAIRRYVFQMQLRARAARS